MSDLEYGCTEYEMPCPAAGGIPCGSERCVRSGECEEEAERYLIRDGEVQYAWLIWGRQPGSGSKPLGCYATREVALAAEEMMRALPEAAEWEDICGRCPRPPNGRTSGLRPGRWRRCRK